MSVFEEIILVRIGLDSGTKYYARSDVVGDHFYEGRVLGSEAVGREVSVLPRDIRIADIGITLDNTDQALSALAAAETFIQKDLTILMGEIGSGESNYEVRAKGKIYSAKYRQDKFEIRAADELYFNLDESLVGARVNPEYFSNLPEGFEEALVPLVIGDPGIRMTAPRIDKDNPVFALAQGRIPTPTVYADGVATTAFTMLRQSYGGQVVSVAQVTSGRDTIVIGDAFSNSIFDIRWEPNPRILIDPSLVVGGAAAYFGQLTLRRQSTGDSEIRFADDQTEAVGVPGPELITDWENFSKAIVIEAGGLSLELGGPNTDTWNQKDAAEPYQMNGSGGTDTLIDDFADAYSALSQAVRDATTLTLASSEPVEVVEWEGPGITDTELEGGSVITNPVRQVEKFLKLQGFDRDATEFSAAAAVAASKSLGGALVFTDAGETLRSALEQIAESYNASVFLAVDGAGIALPDPNAASPTIAAHLNPTNILSGGLNLANVDEVGSRIDYRYNFDPVKQEFLSADTDEDAGSRTALGREIKHNTDMPFVRTSAVAAEIIDDRLVLLEPGRLVGTIEVAPSLASSIDIGSVVSVTHFEGPGVNGLAANPFFVTGISLEAGADAVTLTLTVVDLP